MKYLILTFFLCSTIFANIEGVYDVAGFDPFDNEIYQGICKITHVKDNVYRGEWKELTDRSYTGTGLLYKDHIAFVFINNERTEKFRFLGLQNYRINDNILSGDWVIYDQKLVGTEKMIKR